MPTIHIDKEQFESLLGEKLPEDELKDRISYLGTDLDNIEEGEITVEIFPNRPDMLSAQGFARAFAGFIGKKTGLAEYKVKSSEHKVFVDKSVSKVRPYTACAIVKNLELNQKRIESIVEFQEKLHVTYGRNRRRAAIGIYPLEKIEPPIRFIAKKPEQISFVPLEFAREMGGQEILEEHPKGKDFAHLLEGKNKFPLFVDSKGDVLSMPPIINSETVGKVTQDTKDVFIECSGFDFRILRKCLNMIVTSLADMGGEIYSMKLEYPDKSYVSPDLSPDKMDIDPDYVNKVLGLSLKKVEIFKLLEKMGYGREGEKVLVPAYRADVMHQIDLVEDVAIAFGFDNFKHEIPDVATVGDESSIDELKRKIAHLMAGFGMLETSTYHLTNRTDLVDKMNFKTDFIELEKASSADYDVLRTWLIPTLMKVLELNKHREYPQKIFELGRVFNKDPKTQTGVREDEKLAVLTAHPSASFTEVKQYLQYLGEALEFDFELKEVEHSSFIPGRVGEVIYNNKPVGIVGELSPIVLDAFGMEMPVSALEINLCMQQK